MGCTHQGNEMFSPHLLTTRTSSLCLFQVKFSMLFNIHDLINRSKKGSLLLIILLWRIHFAFTLFHVHEFEYGGHSDRAIPVPIPNTEDKPVHVPYCTEVRESSGTLDRCHTQLYSYFIQFYFLFNFIFYFFKRFIFLFLDVSLIFWIIWIILWILIFSGFLLILKIWIFNFFFRN